MQVPYRHVSCCSIEHLVMGCSNIDTDSCSFEWPLDTPLPTELSIGSFLGDLEPVEPTGTRITEFIALGAKSYGYRCVHEPSATHKSVIKAKGISFAMRQSGQLDFDVMKKVLFDNECVRFNATTFFRRDVRSASVRSVATTKRFRSTLTKRQFRSNSGYRSVPFGFVE